MKRIFLSIVAIFFLLQASIAVAHPGRTDSKSGHTCKTNCEKWGLKYGQYHYHTKDEELPEVKTEAKKESKTEARDTF